MPSIARNQLQIDRAACVNGKRTLFQVSGVPGLVLDITPKGARTWRVRYQVGKGAAREQRRYTIGDARVIGLAKAAEKAAEVLAAVKLERRDPHTERKLGDTTTFGGVFALWLEQHAKPNKSSWHQDEAMFNRHVKARLGHRAITDLRKRDYIVVLDAIAKESGGWQANRAQALITGVLNWAENDGKIEEHSAKGIAKRLKNEPSRERVLTDDEIKRWWASLDEQCTPRMARLLRLLLLTGVRLSELCRMAKSELRGDLWEIPGDHTKSKRPHTVPLAPFAVQFFEAASEDAGESPHMFPAFDRHRMMDQPVTRHAPDRAYARIALKLKMIGADGKVDTGIHDLRRTCATGLARLGVPTDLINRIQGRRAGDRVGAIYNRHEYLTERRDALERWEREVLRIIGQ